MPLYGRGLKRPAVFRAALLLNDLLSWRRNAGVASALQVPRSRLVSAAEAAALFPAVDRDGLQGGALWHDAVMLSPERIAIEMLRWACACGRQGAELCPGQRVDRERRARQASWRYDRVAGRELHLQAPTVINAAGPWSGALAGRLASGSAALFRPALAFNLLLNRPPVATVAVAVEPRRPDAPTYFCLPWKGLLLAGTSYAPVQEGDLEAVPSAAQIAAYLTDLNRAVPGLNATPDDVVQVYAGLLPAKAAATVDLANREVIHDHGAAGGPKGLFSVSGVKYTTARLVAEKTLAKAFGKALPALADATRPPVPGLAGESILDGAALGGPEQMGAQAARAGRAGIRPQPRGSAAEADGLDLDPARPR